MRLVEFDKAYIQCDSRGAAPMSRSHPAADADEFLACVALVAEERLVAGRTVGVAVANHIATSHQSRVALETREVSDMPVTIHRLRRLARKYQLYIHDTDRSHNTPITPCRSASTQAVCIRKHTVCSHAGFVKGVGFVGSARNLPTYYRPITDD